MTDPSTQHPIARRLGSFAPIALAAVLIAGLLPAGALASAAVGATPAAEAVVPVATAQHAAPASIQYQDALAHAGDPNRFAAGGTVTVPFVPRAGDSWPVDGRAPRTLPAGATSGQAMAVAAGRLPATSTSTMPRIVVGARASGGAAGSGAAGAGARNGPVALPRLLVPQAVVPRATSLRRQVFGFLPYWQLTDPSTTLDFSLLSTVAYFSVGVDSKGNLVKKNSDGTVSTGWGGWTSAQMTTVINQAHQGGTRVVLCLTMFAWSSSDASTQGAFLGNATARANLAAQAAAAVRDRGADGINLDFEPIASGHGGDFAALIRQIRSALDAIAPGYQLTYDTTAETGNYPLEDSVAPGAADGIFVMGYDYRTDGASAAGSIAPLNGPTYNLTTTLQAYLARVPASKLILGIPYYGRAWSTTSNAPHARTQTGTRYGAAAAVPYTDAADLAATNAPQYDSIESSPWIAYQKQNCSSAYGCVTTWRELYYDNAQSLREKYDLVNRDNLAGVGMWALGYDGTKPELYQALADKFLNDTTPPLAGIVDLAPSQSSESFPVTWIAEDDWSGVASFDVQVSADGGPWTDWLTATTATSGTYAGSDGHGYAFRVRATDGKGNVGPWNVTNVYDPAPALAPGGFATVVADGLNVRAAPDPNAQRLTSLSAGTVVAITDGPVSAGGYTWYQVTEPVTEWGPVSPVLVGVWIASGSGATPFLQATRAPNTTVVGADIGGLAFGDPPIPAGSTASGTAFSPNGDGIRDSIAITWTDRLAFDSVTLAVAGADGTPVGAIPLGPRGSGAQRFDWDGRLNGTLLPDGTYLLQLVATGAGATVRVPSAMPTGAGQAARWGITIDTVPPVLTAATVNHTTFSPNGDGRLDTVTLAAAAPAAMWQFTVQPLSAGVPGAAIRTATGVGGTISVVWDGRNDAGVIVPDGSYRLGIAVTDAAGNAAQQTWDVTVDTQAPRLTTTLAPALVSPNGDGAAETTALAWTADEAGSGRVELLSGAKVLRTWTAPAATGSVTWDGRDRSGRGVVDGRYALLVTLVDAAGNQATSRIVVTVDRTASLLRWSAGRFAPRHGGTSTVSFHLSRGATATLAVTGPDGRTVRTAWRNRTFAAGTTAWTWDGRAANRTLVPAGRYVATLTVRSSIGTATLTRTVIVQ